MVRVLARGLAMAQVRELVQAQVWELALASARGLVQAERAPVLERVSGQALELEPDWALALDQGLVLESAQVLDSGRELALEPERGWLNRLRRRRRSTPMRNSPSEGRLIAMPQAALP